MNLELFALRWLLYEKRCEIAICERSPRADWCGEPDALGITSARYLIEIEIKRTVSDFRADSRKRSRQPLFRDAYRQKLPKQFYYLVPAELIARVEPLVPEWAGLMRGPTAESYAIAVVKPAPVNHESKRLTVKEACRLVRMVANWAMSTAETYQAAVLRFREGHYSWPEPDYEI